MEAFLYRWISLNIKNDLNVFLFFGKNPNYWFYFDEKKRGGEGWL